MFLKVLNMGDTKTIAKKKLFSKSSFCDFYGGFKSVHTGGDLVGFRGSSDPQLLFAIAIGLILGFGFRPLDRLAPG